MADFGQLSRLLGRDFGCEVTIASDEMERGVHRRYRIDPRSGSAMSLTMSASGNDGATIRALLAIVEHQLLSSIMGPFASMRDDAVLSATRGLSDRVDAFYAEADALRKLLDLSLADPVA